MILIKRIFFLILPVIILAAGCSAESIEPRTDGFSATVEIHGNVDMTAVITVTAGGVFSAKITEPSLLSGLSIIFDGDRATASYLGIERELDSTALPRAGALQAVRRALILAGRSGEPLKKNGGAYTLSGLGDAGKYLFTFRADGFPLTLDLPDIGLSVSFNDLQYVFN